MNEVVIKVIGNYSYQTSRCLGEGVYGKVYEGMERQSKEKVAIKKIDLATFTNDRYLENAIFSQIYLLKRFNHPNIVKFKDVLSSKNSLYIITEFCKNGDLKEMIKRKRFKEEDAFQIMRQILNGFSELIKEKIIHRDLKPANILIHEGVYKIGDFGFAKYVDNFGSQMLKSCVGSPIYMAPQILERTQYTTKCDIWSLGIIFYEMIHGYPPWKARDQPELLRSIKNFPISYVIKRSSLSPKANQFLKKTLAFSEEERICWSQLFDHFGKAESSLESSDEKYSHNFQQQQSSGSKAKEKDRGRIASTSSAANLPGWSNLPTVRNNLTPYSGSNNNINRANSRSNLKNFSPERNRTPFHTDKAIVSDAQKTMRQNVQGTQLESIKEWRQFCVYYHFYCVELMLNYEYISNITKKPEMYGKLLLALAMMVKYKSTFCQTLITLNGKGISTFEELLKKMQGEHESYEQIFVDVTSTLEKSGIHKSIRSQMSNAIGHGEVINENKIEKLENYMLTVANQNAQVLSEQVRRRAKIMKELILVEVLDYVMDILALGLGKSKILKQMSEDSKEQDDDLKNYVTRVISKADRLTSNI